MLELRTAHCELEYVPLRMHLRQFIYCLCALFLIGCSNDQASHQPKADTFIKTEPVDSSRKNIILPKKMKIVRQSAYDNFNVRIGDQLYKCSYKGVIEISDTTGQNVRFLFDLEAEYLIDAIYFHPLGEDLYFVAWQETDHTGLKSHFATFKAGSKSPVWSESQNAPAPGQPVIDGSYVYVTTLGMVGKLNVYSGEKAWQHDSLFDPYKNLFKQFERPLLYKSMVCFYDVPIPGKKNRRDSIWVNDATGRIGK
jgi:hypothetical protein